MEQQKQNLPLHLKSVLQYCKKTIFSLHLNFTIRCIFIWRFPSVLLVFTRPLISKLDFCGYLNFATYPTREIRENLMHAKNTCFTVPYKFWMLNWTGYLYISCSIWKWRKTVTYSKYLSPTSTPSSCFYRLIYSVCSVCLPSACHVLRVVHETFSRHLSQWRQQHCLK